MVPFLHGIPGIGSLQDRRALDAGRHVRYVEHQSQGDRAGSVFDYQQPGRDFLNDSDADGGGADSAVCFDVDAHIGNGITKPPHGVDSVSH
jgi:hypothetical protein